MKKPKTHPKMLTSRSEAEACLNELAVLMNNQRKVVADRDAAVLAINERVAPELTRLSTDISEHTETLQAWAQANPSEFPKDRKSLKLTSGTLLFRTGQPKLELLSRAFSWQKVLSLVSSKMPAFVRRKEEVDKEGLLGLVSQVSDKDAAAATLREIGLQVTQDESFEVKPDLTEQESKQTAGA